MFINYKVTILIPFAGDPMDLLNAIKSLSSKIPIIYLIIDHHGKLDGTFYDIMDQYNLVFQIVSPISKLTGLGSLLSFGVTYINTPYFARMDSDDISILGRIEEQLKIFESINCDLLASNVFIDNKKSVFTARQSGFITSCSDLWILPHPTWFGSTEWLKKNIYSEQFLYAQDFEVLLRALPYSRFYFDSKPLLIYNVGNINRKKRILKSYFRVKALVKNYRHKYFICAVISFLKLFVNLVRFK